MSSAAYWTRVALLREIAAQNHAAYTISEIEKMYSDVIKDLNAEIRKVFNTYTGIEDITEAEAVQLINSAQSDEISKKLQKILESTEDPTKRAELTRKIHTQAYGARISRLEAVMLYVYSYFAEKANAQISKTKTLYGTVINESYYRTVHDIAKGCNVGINFSLVPQGAVDEILAEKWQGSRFSERVWANTEKTAAQAQNIIANGLFGHKTYNQMSEELAAAVKSTKYSAVRLVRTETNHFLNAAEVKAYEDLGLEEYKYLASLDERTCEVCAPLDGRIFKMSERREGVNYPTMHPNCRCTTTVPTDYAKRWARDPLSGKGYKIDDMTYDEWINSLTDEQKAAFETNVKMYKNRSGDKKQYEKYVERLGAENVPKTFDLWQDLKYNRVGEYEIYKSTYANAIEVIKGGADGKQSIILSKHTKIKSIPNSITQVVRKGGGINRNFYDSEGLQYLQISNNNHGNPKQHPFGVNGEHAHDYVINEQGIPAHGAARELSDKERKENGDIL